jgi:Spy/CpxP family protein refolding chaperone
MELTDDVSFTKGDNMILNNRKNVSKIVVAFCIAALTSFATIALADFGGRGEDNHQHSDFKRIAKKLGLTDAQKAQAKIIFQGNKDVATPIMTSLRTEQKNLQALIHADAVDEAAIRAETVKVAGIQADLNVNRAKVGAQFRAILTPEQLTILKTMHKKGHRRGDKSTTSAE